MLRAVWNRRIESGQNCCNGDSAVSFPGIEVSPVAPSTLRHYLPPGDRKGVRALSQPSCADGSPPGFPAPCRFQPPDFPAPGLFRPQGSSGPAASNDQTMAPRSGG